MSGMVQVSVQTLVVGAGPSPSILVLVPTQDYETRQTCRVVPIWMGGIEAGQLGLALEGTKMTRPLSHDLFLDAITNLDATVDHVEITEVRGQTFFAALVLRSGQRLVTLDARPSDAVSLAIRQGAPIYMDENVLDAASYPFVFRNEDDEEKELDAFREFVQSLSPEDFEE